MVLILGAVAYYYLSGYGAEVSKLKAEAEKFARQQKAEAELFERQRKAEAEKFEREKAAEIRKIHAEAIRIRWSKFEWEFQQSLG